MKNFLTAIEFTLFSIEIILIAILISLNNKTVTVYADWRETESRPASTASVEYDTVNYDSIQRVNVFVCVPSVYVVSIPKETENTFTVEVNGDIASDERLHLVAGDIDKYLYFDELPSVITGRKLTKEKMNFKISLERSL